MDSVTNLVSKINPYKIKYLINNNIIPTPNFNIINVHDSIERPYLMEPKTFGCFIETLILDYLNKKEEINYSLRYPTLNLCDMLGNNIVPRELLMDIFLPINCKHYLDTITNFKSKIFIKNEQYKICGEIDLLLDSCVIDIKCYCSNTLCLSNYLQILCYHAMLDDPPSTIILYNPLQGKIYQMELTNKTISLLKYLINNKK